MRYMIVVKATPDSEAGVMPEESLLAQMAAYHEECESRRAGRRRRAQGELPGLAHQV
jgi:hypothetical protein